MSIGNGDKVSWNTPQSTTHRVAHERRVQEFILDGQKFNASADSPYWIVESDKSGARAAHKESSLRPAG
jgi:hypothetical protein